jgi:restriction system protein
VTRKSYWQGRGGYSERSTPQRQYWPRLSTASEYPIYVSVFQIAPALTNVSVSITSFDRLLSTSGDTIFNQLKRNDFCFGAEPPKLLGELPAPPAPPRAAPTFTDAPKWEEYEPRTTELRGFQKFADYFSGKSKAEKIHAEAMFRQATLKWEAGASKRESTIKGYETELANYQSALEQYNEQKRTLEAQLEAALVKYELARQSFDNARAVDLAELRELEASCLAGEVNAIERATRLICLGIPSPLALPNNLYVKFDPESSVLLIDLEVPNTEEANVFVPLKTKSRPINKKEAENLQQLLTFSIALRVLHEIFRTELFERVGLACANCRLTYVNRSTGQRVENTIASIAVEREEFSGIDVSSVDPRLCFRTLKGLTTPSYSEMSAIKPILTLDRNDRRIVKSREVLDEINQSANLASMNWDDFEHLVRELFSRMFSARSELAEVNVTRASRDYGVDAIVFDPDPIHGGKFIIQAKRYVNRVDVSAVRDLYGTVQNEGANKGFLVTTSSFGPDAHAFAKDKPLTLIDGQNLLHLFAEYGYKFRIDLNEARQDLNLRPKLSD